MARIKHEALLPQMKEDFAAVCKVANIDLADIANHAVKSGKWPTQAIWGIFSEICFQRDNPDDNPIWAWRAERRGTIPRVLPFTVHNWSSITFYADGGNDSHIDSLLRRVLVSFADADKA